MAKVMHEISDIIDNYGGLSRTVLKYTQLMKTLVDAAKKPGFSAASWEPIAALVAVDEFERIGNFKEVMNWKEYVDFLTAWAMSSEWECSFKRITEKGDLVFLELEERSKIGDFGSAVNSLTLYEFNDAGKLRNLHVYLQMELPDPEMLKSYEGVL